MKIPITITHTTRSDIYIGALSPEIFQKYLRRYHLGNFCVIVTNPTVYRLYGARLKRLLNGCSWTVCLIPDSEKAKSFPVLVRIIKALASANASIRRKTFMLCLGGGVVGDVGGLAASLYRRGVPYVQMPTTLLAQIDSSVGGKTAINIGAGKNLVGQYYHPSCICVDPVFLKTLPAEHVQEGLAEAVKYGLIADSRLFAIAKNDPAALVQLHQATIGEVIRRCLRIKSRLVSIDERERGSLRTILNFGHTIGHALEAQSSYKSVSHGRAVSIGMVGAAYISWKKKLCPRSCLGEIERVLSSLGLPVRAPIKKRGKAVMRHLLYDKKFTTGSIRMVLLERVGSALVVPDIESSLVEDALAYIAE